MDSRQDIGAHRDGNGPLRIFTYGDTGNAQTRGLLLDAARVGDHQCGVAHEPQEIQVT